MFIHQFLQPMVKALLKYANRNQFNLLIKMDTDYNNKTRVVKNKNKNKNSKFGE